MSKSFYVFPSFAQFLYPNLEFLNPSELFFLFYLFLIKNLGFTFAT